MFVSHVVDHYPDPSQDLSEDRRRGILLHGARQAPAPTLSASGGIIEEPHIYSATSAYEFQITFMLSE
jgi:hypothetical protein